MDKMCQVIGCNKAVFKGKHHDYEVENRFLCYGHWIWHEHVPELKPFEQPAEPTEVVYSITFTDAEYTQEQLCKHLGDLCICCLCTPPERWKDGMTHALSG